MNKSLQNAQPEHPAASAQIMVLDDEPQVLAAIEDTLGDQYRLLLHTSPKAALAFIRENPQLSVILSDQRMPEMNGHEFLGKAQEYSDATRVLITGYSDLEAVIRAVNHGKIFSYVSKPWDADHLKMVVYKAIEHHRLLLALREEQRLLHNLMDNVPDSIFFKDRQLRYVRMNWVQARRLGIEHPDLARGRTLEDFRPPEVASPVTAEEQAILDTGEPIIDRIRRHDVLTGEVGWMSGTKVPIRDDSGSITGLVSIGRDITKRKRAEDENRLLLEIAREVSRLDDINEAFRAVLSKIGETLDWSYAEAWLHQGEELVCLPAFWGDAKRYGNFRRSYENWTFKPGIGMVGRVWSSGKAEWINDIGICSAAKFKRAAAARACGLRTCLAVPIVMPDGSTFAVIVLFHAGLRKADQHLTEVVISIAGQLGETFARRAADAAMRASEEKLRLILDSTAEAIYGIDLEGRCTFCNPACARILGYSSASELIGKDMHWLIQRGSANGVAYPRGNSPIFKTNFSGNGVHRDDEFFQRADGSSFPVEYWAYPMQREGQIVGTVVAFSDISIRREHEHRIERLTRIHGVLSGINSTIVRVRDRDELFREACRIGVRHGKFDAVWIGMLDENTQTLATAAWDGPEECGRLWDIVVSVRAGDLKSVGAVAQAFRSRQPVVTNDMQSSPESAGRRRAVALQLGYRATASFPLLVDEKCVGCLSLFTRELNAFDDEAVALLREMTGDIAFALQVIDKFEQLDYLSYYDPLTELPLRSVFEARLNQTLATGTEGGSLAVVLLDVRRLHIINESLGRHAGDAVLHELAKRLQRVWPTSGLLARAASGVFAGFMQGLKESTDVAGFLEDFHAQLAKESIHVDGSPLQVDLVAGIAMNGRAGVAADGLYVMAEAALLRAKQTDRRYAYYEPGMNETASRFMLLHNNLRKALASEQFVLHYQPKQDLLTGRISGLEALIRWNDPETGLVPPDHFIPILEETGLIIEVGLWAIRKALADYCRWRETCGEVPKIAVNVSSLQLRQDDFSSILRGLIEASPHGAEGLEIEITESLLMHDIEKNIAMLQTLKEMGVNAAIDDFGTGYSSLSYLARLPISALKIDRNFVETMLENSNSMSIVTSIIQLAHTLNMKVIAEGVELEEQARMLRLLRCDEMQGYLISKPLPAAELEARFLLERRK